MYSEGLKELAITDQEGVLARVLARLPELPGDDLSLLHASVCCAVIV